MGCFCKHACFLCKKDVVLPHPLRAMMLVREHRDVSLQALNLIVGMYLQPFEVVYNIGTL